MPASRPVRTPVPPQGAALPGLDPAEAARRLGAEGPNLLPGSAPKSSAAIVRDVLTEPMFLMLLAAGGIYLALGSRAEAVFLLGFVFVVIGITLAQERRSRDEADGQRQLVAREIIGQQRIGGGRERGLADADTHARQKQHHIGVGQAAQRRHEAPHGDARGHDAAAVAGIGPASGRIGNDVVEAGEGEAHDQRYLRVGKTAKVALHRPDHQVEDLPVDER